MAAQYGGNCYLRFDDTNPEAEKQEYIDHIMVSATWKCLDAALGPLPDSCWWKQAAASCTQAALYGGSAIVAYIGRGEGKERGRVSALSKLLHATNPW
eukprot:1160755-Pelagomonas_calceolata.AAC.10